MVVKDYVFCIEKSIPRHVTFKKRPTVLDKVELLIMSFDFILADCIKMIWSDIKEGILDLILLMKHLHIVLELNLLLWKYS